MQIYCQETVYSTSEETTIVYLEEMACSLVKEAPTTKQTIVTLCIDVLYRYTKM